jgi:transcription elongation factor GreA
MAGKDTRQRISAEGKAKAEAELEYLKTVKRPDVVQAIKTAREFGDLKENAEYHAAKDDQAHLEARIRALEAQLANVVVVDDDEVEEGVAALGAEVTFADEDGGDERTVSLVHSLEASLAEGKISVESPLGAALVGGRAGDVVEMTTPKTVKRLRIVTVG